MIVIAGLGGMDPALPGKGGAEHLLGRGFADRAGDGTDPGFGAGAGSLSQVFERPLHIRHDQQRRIGGYIRRAVGHQSGCSAFDQRCRHKIMPVPVGPQCHEQITGAQGPGVDRHAIGLPVGRAAAAGGRVGLGPGPQRGHAPGPGVGVGWVETHLTAVAVRWVLTHI